MDLAVADAEGFDQRDGVGPLQRRFHLPAVGEQVAVEFIGVVEKAGGHHHAALHVDQWVAAFADAFVDAVDAELELRLAARRDRSRIAAAWRSGRGQDAVLQTPAVRIERREHIAVVQLDGIEVTIGHGAQPLARAALLRRQDVVEGGIVHHLGDIREGQRQSGVAHHHGFGFDQQAVAHRESQGEVHGLAVLLGGAQPGRLPHLRVRGDEAGGCNASGRGPHPFPAEGQFDVVLGEAHGLGLLQRRRIAPRQCGHVVMCEPGQAGMIAVRGAPGGALARGQLGHDRTGHEQQRHCANDFLHVGFLRDGAVSALAMRWQWP